MRRFLVLLTALTAALAGCGVEGPPAAPIDGHPTTLAGTSWIVTAIGGRAVPGGSQPTIAFDSGQAQGSGGCNHFGGRYRYDPTTGQLQFQEMGMTAMACAEQVRNDIETAFVQAVGQPSLIARLEPGGHLVLAGTTSRIDLDPVGPAVTD